MRSSLLLIMLAFSVTIALGQALPVPVTPKGNSVTVAPLLQCSNPTRSFRSFQFQVDTDSSYSSAYAYTSGWQAANYLYLNYDSMHFQKKYYWRVRSVKTGATDTSSWSYSYDFFTGWQPTINFSSKNQTVSGPSANVNITSAGAKRRVFESDTSLSFSSPFLRLDTITNTSFRITGMFFGKKHYVRFRDITSVSISPYSDTATLTVQTTGSALDYPSSATTIYPPRFFVKIRANEDLSSFETEHDTSVLFNSPLYVKNAFSGTTTFSGNDLLIAQKYYIRTRAIRGTDTSSWSLPLSVTTAYTPFLQKPANNSTGNSTTPLLEILGPKGNPHDIQLDTVSSFNSGYLKNFSATTPYDSNNSYYKDMSVAAGTLGFNRKYYYRSRFRNSIDTSEWSSAYSFITIQPYVYLSRPFSNGEHIEEEAEFNWNSVKGVGGYHLQVSEDSFTTVYKERFINHPDSFFTYISLQQNTIYYARIRVFSQYDTTAWYYPVKFRTRLPFVKKIAPFDSAGVANDSVPLVWNSAGAGLYYEVAVWSDKSLVTRVLKDSVTDTVYYFHPPVRGKMYFWDVKAGAGNYKDPSWYFNQQRAFVPGLATPQLQLPANASVDTDPKSVTFKWGAVPGAKGYSVEISLEPSFTGPLKGDVPVNNAVVSNLPAGMLHYWRVRAYLDFYSNYSQVFTFTTKSVSTGTGDMRFENAGAFEVYPNPFSETLHILIPPDAGGENHTMRLYNISGKLVKETIVSRDDAIVDTRDIAPGIYIYRMIHKDGVAQGKIVKN